MAYSPIIQIILALASSVQVLTQSVDDELVLVEALPEDVLDDHDGLLHHIVDLGSDEVEQGGHAALDFDGAAADSSHGFTHEIYVNFSCVFFELG